MLNVLKRLVKFQKFEKGKLKNQYVCKRKSYQKHEACESVD